MNKKREILRLQNKIKSLEETINEINNRLWKTENPPRFKIGDEVKLNEKFFKDGTNISEEMLRSTFRVLEIEIRHNICMYGGSKYWSYKIVSCNKNIEFKIYSFTDEHLIKK